MTTSTQDATAPVPAAVAVVSTVPAHQTPTVRPTPLPTDPAAQASRARLRSDLLRMAHALTDDPAFGGEGSLIAGEQEVDIARLWRPDFFDPIRYSEEEIEARRAAIVAANYTIDEPVIVVKALDPTPVGRGVKRADLMIVANALTWEAATRLQSIRALPVLVREKLSLFHAMISIAQGFTLHHKATPLETGRLILRLILSDQITRRQQPELDLPSLTQKRLAEIIGATQATVSRYAALAKEDDDLLDRVDAGELPVGHALELRYAPPEAREALVEQVIERAQSGDPMTRDETRAEVQVEQTKTGKPPKRTPNPSGPRAQRGSQPWMASEVIRPPQAKDLLFTDVFEFSPPEVYCALLHDAYVWGRQFREAKHREGTPEHRDFRDFMALMERPTLRAQLEMYVNALRERIAQNIRGE